MKHALIETVFFLSLVSTAFADAPTSEKHECTTPRPHSSDLEKFKTLNGKWEGTTEREGKTENVKVNYHVSGGGSTVVETLFPGEPMEMISMYHDEHGKLAMTHYCAMGNQPRFDLVSSKRNEIELCFGKSNSLNPKSEDHMHGLKVIFVDADHIEERWTGMSGGKLGDPTVFRLTRVRE